MYMLGLRVSQTKASNGRVATGMWMWCVSCWALSAIERFHRNHAFGLEKRLSSLARMPSGSAPALDRLARPCCCCEAQGEQGSVHGHRQVQRWCHHQAKLHALNEGWNRYGPPCCTVQIASTEPSMGMTSVDGPENAPEKFMSRCRSWGLSGSCRTRDFCADSVTGPWGQ